MSKTHLSKFNTFPSINEFFVGKINILMINVFSIKLPILHGYEGWKLNKPVIIQSELQFKPNQPMRMLEIAITLESCPQHCFYIRQVLHFQNWCSIWSIYCINGALTLPTHKVQFNIYCPILNCTLWVGKNDAPFFELVLHLEHILFKWSTYFTNPQSAV